MPRPPLVAVALISATALAYEVLLTRLFSIVLWHHFAYLIISAALLGYGASGTLLALLGETAERRFATWFVTSAALFGLLMPACFWLAERVPFNPLELLWDPAQPGYLFVTYLLLFPPFFCAATCICLALAHFRGQAHRIYGVDILGAGAGSLGVVALLFVVSAPVALRTLGAIGLATAALASIELRLQPRRLVPALVLLAAVVAVVVPADWTRLELSPYKELAQTRRIAGTRVIAERHSPLGQLSVVASPVIPLRHAPGLSLNANAEPPPQLGVFTDGDGLNVLTRFDGRRTSLAYLDHLTSAAPYHLLADRRLQIPRPGEAAAPAAPLRVVVLGAGAGADVLQGLYHGATIEAVELNPQLIDLVRGPYADYAGGLYARPDVRVHAREARGFVAGTRARYDLIQVALLDSFSTASAGLYSLTESTIYTVEAFQDYLRHLEPDGLLAITRWISLPPRDILKLFGTAVVALEREQVRQPGAQLALIRGWKTATLLVKNGEFTPADLATLRAFCRARSFDVDWYPGITPAEVNRYNVLDQPWFHEGAVALLGPLRDRFIERYKFHIAPATDDKPYFFRFFRWATARELLALKEQGGLPLLEWGYPVLLMTLAQALVASLVLVLLPLLLRRGRPAEATERGRVVLYFLAVGCGFMFVEIAVMQKFMLFLAHPLHGVAVVLSAFLVFAGIGSRLSGMLASGPLDSGPMRRAVTGIALLALVYVVALPPLFRSLVPLPDTARIALAVVLIAPLALCMGVPFPSGLDWVAARFASLVPWAWAVNGCASVVGAVLATLLAVHLGFTAVVFLAVAFYGLALAARVYS